MNIKNTVTKLLSSSTKYLASISIGIMILTNPVMANENFTKISIEQSSENYNYSNVIDSEIDKKFSLINKNLTISSSENTISEIINEDNVNNTFITKIKFKNGDIKEIKSNKKLSIGNIVKNNFDLQQVFFTDGGFAKYSTTEGINKNVSVSKYIQIKDNDGKIIKTINIINIEGKETQIMIKGDVRITLAQLSISEEIIDNKMTLSQQINPEIK